MEEVSASNKISMNHNQKLSTDKWKSIYAMSCKGCWLLKTKLLFFKLHRPVKDLLYLLKLCCQLWIDFQILWRHQMSPLTLVNQMFLASSCFGSITKMLNVVWRLGWTDISPPSKTLLSAQQRSPGRILQRKHLTTLSFRVQF